MSDKPKDFGVICEHGGLRRKCDSCALIDREVELDAAEAEIARLREREREIYNRLDRCLAFLRPRTVVAQMYQDAPDG